MKIAMIVPALVNKGPVIVAKDLCTKYVSWGHKCVVFYFDEKNEIEFPCETNRIEFWKKRDFSDFDIVHTHQYRPDAYAYIHRLYKQTIVVSTLHQHIEQQLKYDDSRSNLANKFGVITWFLFLKRFHKIVALTPFHEKYYIEKGLNTCVINNGRFVNTSLDIDAEDTESILYLKSKHIVLASVAFVTARKGLDQAISAVSDNEQYALMVVGDGPDLDRLKDLAKEKGIEDRCLFVGNKKDGYRYLKYADIFVLCSYAEGFPLALIEASAYGVPAVCSDIEAISSIMSSNEVCYYHLGEIGSLREAINYAEKNKDTLSSKMKMKYKTNFSDEAMAKKYVSLYESLIRKTKGWKD